MKIKKIIVALLFCTSLLLSQQISFKELTKLASEDLQKNIYLDKDIKNYQVEFNIVDHQKRGEMYEFYKIVLFDNNLRLSYNRNADFYTVSNIEPIYQGQEPLPLHPSLQLHYYNYKIKNITNEDVVKAMAIFPSVKYQYLKQSDMIVYSCTREQHKELTKILQSSDNKVATKTIKITLFSVRTDRLLEYGSEITAFDFSMDSSISTFYNSLLSSVPAEISLSTLSNFSLTMRALKSNGLADIFQEPTIRLTNGADSSTNAVINLPYLKSTSTVDSQTNSITEQYDYKDVGLKINIHPKIKDNWVYLKLNLVLEELISNDEDRPITQKISYENSIRVVQSKPVLLTGIQKIFKKENDSGIPILSSLPYIGELFKLTTKNKEEQNINILLEVL